MKFTRTLKTIVITLILSSCLWLPITDAYAATDLTQAKIVEVSSKETSIGVEKTLMIASGPPRDFAVSALPIAVTYVNVSISGAGSVMKANITCTGSAMNTSLTMSLQSLATGGAWATQNSVKGITFKSNKSVSISKFTTQTRYWKINLVGRFLGNTIDYNTNAVLYNSKAVRYPFVSEIYSGRVLMMPPTNLKVNQIARDSAFRSKYISNFEWKYPNTRLDWSNYQIHHIRPLKYGGTNSLENGMAVPNSQHILLTTWWLNY